MWRVNILLLQKPGSAHGWEGRKVVKVRCAVAAAAAERNSLEHCGKRREEKIETQPRIENCISGEKWIVEITALLQKQFHFK